MNRRLCFFLWIKKLVDIYIEFKIVYMDECKWMVNVYEFNMENMYDVLFIF